MYVNLLKSIFTASMGSASVRTIRTLRKTPISFIHLLIENIGISDNKNILIPQYKNQVPINAFLLNKDSHCIFLLNNIYILIIISINKIFLSRGLPPIGAPPQSLIVSCVTEVLGLIQKESGLDAEYNIHINGIHIAKETFDPRLESILITNKINKLVRISAI
jgi:hypothetical protein